MQDEDYNDSVKEILPPTTPPPKPPKPPRPPSGKVTW